jgi:hypothetical protein
MALEARGAPLARDQEDRRTTVTIDDKKFSVVIGTSGSIDSPRDTGHVRFWPVTAPDYALACDGLHDETAPTMYLCSACFPDRRDRRGDLAEVEDDECLSDHPDAHEEME